MRPILTHFPGSIDDDGVVTSACGYVEPVLMTGETLAVDCPKCLNSLMLTICTHPRLDPHRYPIIARLLAYRRKLHCPPASSNALPAVARAEISAPESSTSPAAATPTWEKSTAGYAPIATEPAS